VFKISVRKNKVLRYSSVLLYLEMFYNKSINLKSLLKQSSILKKVILIFFIGFLYSGCKKENKLIFQNNPNIILILADDQGWGATSVQMDINVSESASDFLKTPNLERLSKKGVIFSNGYAAHPNCSPTRASILTGKTPAQLKMTDIIDRHDGVYFEGNKLNPPAHIYGLPEKEITIAELIKSNLPFYRTAFFGKWHLAAGGPESHGFDNSDGETSNKEGNQKIKENPKDIFGITNRAITWMKTQVKSETPFFIQISHYATHLAIESKQETQNRVKKYISGKRHSIIDHAAMTEDLDTGVGMILNEIEKLGISDNTYVIYLADNGTYPTKNISNINGPVHGWKATLWEGGLKVPFIISGPGIKSGYRKIAVSTNDILPTISDWLNIDSLPQNIAGGSLAPILLDNKNKITREDDFMLFYFPHYQHQKGTHPGVAIIQGDYKFIKYYEEGTKLLFNLKEDISEVKNIASTYPEKVIELEKHINNYFLKYDIKKPSVNIEYKAKGDEGLNYKEVKKKLMSEAYFIPKI